MDENDLLLAARQADVEPLQTQTVVDLVRILLKLAWEDVGEPVFLGGGHQRIENYLKLQVDDDGVVIDTPTVERADEGLPPKGRRYGGEASTKKAQKTKKAKKAVDELVAGEKAENRRRNEASGADPRNGGPSKGGASAAKSLLDKLNWKSRKSRS